MGRYQVQVSGKVRNELRYHFKAQEAVCDYFADKIKAEIRLFAIAGGCEFRVNSNGAANRLAAELRQWAGNITPLEACDIQQIKYGKKRV